MGSPGRYVTLSEVLTVLTSAGHAAADVLGIQHPIEGDGRVEIVDARVQLFLKSALP